MVSVEVSTHAQGLSVLRAANFEAMNVLTQTELRQGVLVMNVYYASQSPIHYSNVMIADPVTGGPVRTTWRYLEDGTKVQSLAPQFAAIFTFL